MISEDLRRWFKEKWTAQDGSECGNYKGRGRVKCRPSKRVSSESPQTWSEMSPEQKKKAVRLKQKAHREGKQFSSHKSGKTWDGPKNKYKPGKKKMNESNQNDCGCDKNLTEDDQIHSGESPKEYRARLLRTIQSGDITSMDRHDRVHGALAFIQDIQSQYPGHALNVVVRHFLKKGGESNAQGLIVTGIDSKGKNLTGYPTGAGGTSTRHRAEVAAELRNITGLHVSRYPFLNPQHLSVLTRLMDFKGLREMYEQALNEENDCGCDQNLTESKKPYKGFVKGKNHPEGGLSRAEAHRQGIHAGIETKDEAKRKGGFNKLSKKTQSRRKSFCARMCGMKRRRTSSKTAHDPKSKINAALRVWGCRCGTNESYETETPMLTEGKNRPTNAKLWSRAKSLARKKFDVYPSAYANGWAAKWYKKHGGGWESKSTNEGYQMNERTMTTRERIKEKHLHKKMSIAKSLFEERYPGRGEDVFYATTKKMAMKEAFARARQIIKEEVVNSRHKGTMTAKEQSERDRIAKGLKNVKPIKGKPDSEKEAKYRYATYLVLRKREGKEGEGKKKKSSKKKSKSKKKKK